MKFPNFLEFLQEDNGRFSSSRLFALSVSAACILDWMHWIFTQATAWKPSAEAVALVLGVVGAKVVQKFGEAKTSLEGPKEAP